MLEGVFEYTSLLLTGSSHGKPEMGKAMRSVACTVVDFEVDGLRRPGEPSTNVRICHRVADEYEGVRDCMVEEGRLTP